MEGLDEAEREGAEEEITEEMRTAGAERINHRYGDHSTFIDMISREVAEEVYLAMREARRDSLSKI